MNRRLLSIILSVVTVLLLATACTNSDPNDNKTEINTFGNTSGNQANGGLVAVQGEWVYFLLREYPGANGNIICKRRLDDTGATYWTTNAGYNLNLVGNWIYYQDNASFRICKTQTNGEGKYEEISNTDLRSGFQVVGDWIYYSSGDGDGFNKMRSDGRKKKKIMKDTCNLFYVDSNKIFYTTSFVSDDPQGLYSIGINGKGKTPLVPSNIGDIAYINVDEDWIYYIRVFSDIADSQNLGLWRIRKDGTEQIKITEDTGAINVADGWVYYTNSNDNSSLYKIRTDGTEKTKLNSDKTYLINIAGDWIYYPITNSNELRDDLYRIRTDGTDRQRVTLNNFIPETPTTYSVYIQEQTTIPDLAARIPY